MWVVLTHKGKNKRVCKQSLPRVIDKDEILSHNPRPPEVNRSEPGTEETTDQKVLCLNISVTIVTVLFMLVSPGSFLGSPSVLPHPTLSTRTPS